VRPGPYLSSNTVPRRTESAGRIVMGGRMFWAALWVIGIPLPIVLILYFLFGGSH